MSDISSLEMLPLKMFLYTGKSYVKYYQFNRKTRKYQSIKSTNAHPLLDLNTLTKLTHTHLSRYERSNTVECYV